MMEERAGVSHAGLGMVLTDDADGARPDVALRSTEGANWPIDGRRRQIGPYPGPFGKHRSANGTSRNSDGVWILLALTMVHSRSIDSMAARRLRNSTDLWLVSQRHRRGSRAVADLWQRDGVAGAARAHAERV